MTRSGRPNSSGGMTHGLFSHSCGHRVSTAIVNIDGWARCRSRTAAVSMSTSPGDWWLRNRSFILSSFPPLRRLHACPCPRAVKCSSAASFGEDEHLALEAVGGPRRFPPRTTAPSLEGHLTFELKPDCTARPDDLGILLPDVSRC